MHDNDSDRVPVTGKSELLASYRSRVTGMISESLAVFESLAIRLGRPTQKPSRRRAAARPGPTAPSLRRRLAPQRNPTAAMAVVKVRIN